MNNFLKTSALAMLLGFSANLHAQDAVTLGTPKRDDVQSVTIHTTGKVTEKLTIVVDSNKVTINGKPVDEYKGDNVEVYKNDGSYSYSKSFSYSSPTIKSGDWNMFKNGFGKDIKSNKALLGVMTEKTDDGAKITDVTDESAAYKAGLKEGDIITKIGSAPIADGDDLYKVVGKYGAGDTVKIAYKRDGKEGIAKAVLQKNKELRIYGLNNDNNFNLSVSPDIRVRGFSYRGKPRMGMQVQDTEDGKGVKVLSVDDETPADKAGLQEDDIITKIDDKNITSVDDLKNAVKDGKDGDSYKITYMHGTETKTATIKYPKELKTTNL